MQQTGAYYVILQSVEDTGIRYLGYYTVVTEYSPLQNVGTARDAS